MERRVQSLNRSMDRGSEESPVAAHPAVAIVWISVLGLFLELLLIRWVSTEIRIFAYLQNTVLVVCFLGLGAGLFTSRQPARVGQIVWPLVALTGLLAFPITRTGLQNISLLLSTLGDLEIWVMGASRSPIEAVAHVLIGLGLTFLVMALVVRPFIPIGRLLGRFLDDHPRPILAYSLNVAGSLVGIWLFVFLSWMQLSPTPWFVVLGALLLPFLRRPEPRRALHAAGVLSIMGLSAFSTAAPGSVSTVWSPYQKLTLSLREAPAGLPIRPEIRVNNVGYQIMLDLRPETLRAATPQVPIELIGHTQYDIPLLVHPAPRRVLVVGAGSGNDAAGALRHGAEEIVAVEIDPAIVELGREHHPERPYASERVDIVVDDARSFFARAGEERYDLIVFGYLDSHTTTAMTNARLDHYVYTRESIAHAADLLADGGVMVLTFEVRKPFIADRMASALREVFGEEPVAFIVPDGSLGWGGTMFLAGDLDVVESQLAAQPHLAGLIEGWKEQTPLELGYSTRVTSDDWPYLYLPTPRIPTLYFLLGILLLVLYASLRGRLGAPALDLRAWRTSEWHFFFLGAAFLLLEVQNISKASVALGSTWQVNAVIISGVFGMVLVANMIAAKWPRLPTGPVYAALLGSAIGLYFIDLARFAFLPAGPKAVVVGGLTTLPMLFSGIVFVRSWAGAQRKDVALGANLFGALVGAILQSLSFMTGIRALLLIVAGFYALAFLSRRGVIRAEAGVPSVSLV